MDKKLAFRVTVSKMRKIYERFIKRLFSYSKENLLSKFTDYKQRPHKKLGSILKIDQF
jgi:hypothetical protein